MELCCQVEAQGVVRLLSEGFCFCQRALVVGLTVGVTAEWVRLDQDFLYFVPGFAFALKNRSGMLRPMSDDKIRPFVECESILPS